MGEKKYYWIKLKTNFFNSEQIDFLMSQNEGSKYVVLYQMLCLNTANNDGELASKIGEMIVPYNVEKIVRDTKYFNENDVIVSLELFKKLGLIYEEDNQILKIANFEEMVGGESKWAEKKRIYREKQKQLQLGHNGDNVRQEKENRDKSIENRVIDIDIKKDKEYFANAELNSIFLEFIEVRKKLKAVNSDRAIKTLINKLNKYPDNVKYQMIENSIVNSWKDVYELKEKRTTSYNRKPVRQEIVPDWIDQKIEKEEMTPEELAEMEELMKPFKEEYKPNPELQQRLKEKYGKKKSL